VGAVLGSDFAFSSLSRLAPDQMIRTLLATDPDLLNRVPEAERLRARTILDQIFPISGKVDGLRTDGVWAGTPSPTDYERITAPTLILSCEDDLFGTAETARLLADRIPDARLILYPDGGHIWLGHDDALTREIADFVSQTGRS
jgi:pimeloyl-ACP methyl ester carboxylesterase